MNISHTLKTILSIGLLSLLGSCKFSSPQFRQLNQWQISKISGNEISLSNSAVFFNPNSFGGINLSDLYLTVMANGKAIGTISNAQPKVSIPGNAEFSVPFSLSVNPSDLVGSIGSLIGIITGQSVDIRVQGGTTAGYSIFKKHIPIDFTQPVKISDIKR